MRLVSVQTGAGPAAALVRDGRVHPLTGRGSLDDLVQAGLPASLEAEGDGRR